MLLPLKDDFVYGPVRSRRLGASLGINVLPPGAKVCSFNCIYCQYGWTDPDLLEDSSGVAFPPVEAILLAVGKALVSLPEPPAYLTFSGHGEATLHPAFGALVEGVLAIRDGLVPSARTAILSNSAGVGDAAIRAALSRLDVRIMKLDAGTSKGLARFNQPRRGVSIGAIVEGLRLLPDVTLQSLFAAGPRGNIEDDEVSRWIEAVVSIRPRAVQIYGLARGTPSQEILPAPNERLAEIERELGARGIRAEVF